MSRRENKLIDDIERGALDSSMPLADTLRKCVALGGKARSTELREWASRELNGYGPEDELPDWRVVPAQILVDVHNLAYQAKNMQISVAHLPNEVKEHVKDEWRMHGGVAELEATLAGADEGLIRVGIPGGAEIATIMSMRKQVPGGVVDRVFLGVSSYSVLSALDRTRTALTELVAELRAGMADDQDLPTPDLATQAVQVAVGGKRNRVVVTSAHAGLATTTNAGSSASDPESEPPGWKRWAQIGGFVVGIAGVVGAVAGVAQLLG